MEKSDKLTTEIAAKQSTDKQQPDQMKLMETLLASEQEKKLVFHALREVYFAIYHIKITAQQMIEITVRDSVGKDAFEAADVQIALERFLHNLVVPEDNDRMKRFLDLSTLDSRMGNAPSIAEEYRSVTQGWCRFAFIAAARDEQGQLTDVLATVQKIGKEKEAKNKEHRHHLEIQQKQMTVIRGLSAEYYSVILVDYQKDMVEIYRDEPGYGKGIGELFSSFHTWSEGLRSYADDLVVDGNKFFYQALSCEELARRKEDYSLDYKKIGEGGFQYLQIKVVYVELSDGYRIAVIGTKNIDAQVRHEEHQKELLREALELEKKQKIELANSHIRLQAALEEAKQYRHAVLADALVVYEANLTKNLLEKDIIEEYRGERVSIVDYLGLSVPCSYEQVIELLGEKQVVEEDIPLFRTKLSRQYLLDLYEQGKTEDVAELGIRLTTGEVLYIKNTVYLTKNIQTGDIIAHVNVKDLSEQKRQEKKLQDYEHILISTAAETYKGVRQLDLETGRGEYLYFENGAIMQSDMGDWTTWLERQRIHIYTEDYDKVYSVLTLDYLRQLEDGTTFRQDYRTSFTPGEGEPRYYATTVSVLQSNGRKYAVMTSLDNTAAVRSEMEQKKLIEDALLRAEHANRAKTTFLSNMSHDIRTPMNAIIGFTTLATLHIDNQHQVMDYLGKIATSSNHLLSLINDVLDMSRIESGRLHLDEVPCSLSQNMHELRNIMQSDLKAKNLSFSIDTVDVFDENIICDRLRLNQILLNLLGNAVKFTEPGGSISLRISETIGADKDRPMYEFRVKDTGIGMGEDFLAHVFEPFERERNSTVSGIEGTGLGMPITKNIVEMMGGTISVTSQKGAGTEFVVRISFQREKTGQEEVVLKELEGIHALVVDDDLNSCDSVSGILGQIGMRAEWVNSGSEAVSQARQAAAQGDPFGVYVIDWLMPDMSGIETTRQIRREAGEDKPIIILTSYDWGDVEEEAREAGVTAFISKPLFISDIRHCLFEILHQEQPEKEEVKTIPDFVDGQRILLVEDNELNREIASEILGETGFVIEEAEDGSIALEMLREKEPGYYDVILMDIQMPIMDGYTAAKEIRALENRELAQIPIIAMTANAFAEDRKKALACGMNGHVAKPIDVGALLETLRSVL